MRKTTFLALMALVVAVALVACGGAPLTAAPPAAALANPPAPAPAQPTDRPQAVAATSAEEPATAQAEDQQTPPPTSRIPPTFAPAVQHFRVLSASAENTPEGPIATIRGHVWAPNGIPYREIEVTARSADQTITVKTDPTGLYMIRPGTFGPYSVFVQHDEESLRLVDVQEHDVVTIDWVSVPPQPSSEAPTLPLLVAPSRPLPLILLSLAIRHFTAGPRSRGALSGLRREPLAADLSTRTFAKCGSIS